MLDLWYSLVDLFPGDWTRFLFMKQALLAILLVMPPLSLLGVLVVNHRMAFFSDVIGHSALTGLALGALCGMADPSPAMPLFAAALAVLVTLLKHYTRASTDTVIGVIFALVISLGVVLLSRGGGFSRYTPFLIGDLLSIQEREIMLLLVVLVGVLIFWLLFFNGLLLVSVNPTLARSRGKQVRMLELTFALLLALVVTVSIQWVGILIISSLLVLPAAAARNLASSMRQYHVLSLIIAIISGISGLIISYYWGTASGATIVLCAALIFFLTVLGRQMRPN